MTNRFCVFCGQPPKDKTREHILPQWLIELTGNPKRVVNLGTNFNNGQTISFDWSNFCVPACYLCNSEFSELETRAKTYILKLLDRKALSSIEYSDLMDWLDKVRIGVWIGYHFIQGNPTLINPSFHIKNRISKKDRMISIYPISGNDTGLNAFGVESLVFHSQPSCFALRINNILILNISSDYLFSARCGFPYPKTCYTPIDGDNPHLMHLRDFQATYKIKHPLMRKKIAKPSIHLYQPIMEKSNDDRFQSGYLGGHNLFDSFLAQHTMPPYPSGKGILYSQHQDRVEPIYNVNKPIEFEEIKGSDSKPLYLLIKQVYELQNYIFEKNDIRAENKELLNSEMERRKVCLKFNKSIISKYSGLLRNKPTS